MGPPCVHDCDLVERRDQRKGQHRRVTDAHGSWAVGLGILLAPVRLNVRNRDRTGSGARDNALRHWLLNLQR